MKKFLLFLLVLIIALAAATQFLLPSYISSRIEKQLNDSLKPSSQTVNVESQPGFKLLYGEADHVYGSLDDVKLGKLNFANFNYEQTWNNCLQEYSAEAYDEYLDEYVERAQNDAIAIYDSKKQDFEDVSDIFIRGIDSIIEVLKLVEELIDRYKDARISADIDNT